MFFHVDQYAYYNYIYDNSENTVLCNSKLVEFKDRLCISKHIETFLRNGTRQNFIEGIELLKNAHSYTFENHNKNEKLELEMPLENISMSNFNASILREELFNIIANHYKDKDIDLVISGGVDSSLLLAVLADADWLHKVRVWTTKTPAGNDYYFAKKSADSVGIKLNTIEVNYESEFDFDILKESSNLNFGPANIGVVPLSFIGKAVKFNGGSCLMHGMAGETISINIYKSLEENYLQVLFRDSKYLKLLKQIFNLRKIKQKEVFSILKKYKNIKNINLDYLHMYNLCCGSVKHDTNRVRNNIEVSGISSFTPYFNKLLEKYMMLELEGRFHQKIPKIISRLAMDKIISDEVVWRKDDQGLRWDPKKYINFHKSKTDAIINKYLNIDSQRLEVNAKYIRNLEVASLYALIKD
ncbi:MULTISPECIES: asparagine synthase-related protein [unclassified Sulfurospirillum]|uniref:asparagine synthase-related protein n=1 Tax=unclassified Sulfurospirillum TaxID=2618290 RepID=UPI000503BE49|nr:MULTISPECIES: asparagine synthase-related protein [unclassified Sulfurospirillum]KFL35123.1 hypothetical protein JU57_02160 [Sulfurospirillum sp. SCADC]